MRYLALATDYDGTLAADGRVSDDTIAALESLQSSGRKLILVTGRELDDLQRVFPQIDLFDYIVAENGALLYSPATREEKLLGASPPEEFVKTLRDRQVDPLSVGRVIVATWHPNENTVLETIRDLGLELQVIFNKGAVMVLPSGINKAAGLTAALSELKLSSHNVVGVGDAENDHAFTGAQGKLHLGAQNLILFTQLGEGVDDETWLYHLQHGDYSHWFREAIKDESLAEEVEKIEQTAQISASESRAAIKAAIEQRYTLPA